MAGTLVCAPMLAACQYPSDEETRDLLDGHVAFHVLSGATEVDFYCSGGDGTNPQSCTKWLASPQGLSAIEAEFRAALGPPAWDLWAVTQGELGSVRSLNLRSSKHAVLVAFVPPDEYPLDLPAGTTFVVVVNVAPRD
jgi:hypothetical protein